MSVVRTSKVKQEHTETAYVAHHDVLEAQTVRWRSKQSVACVSQYRSTAMLAESRVYTIVVYSGGMTTVIVRQCCDPGTGGA